MLYKNCRLRAPVGSEKARILIADGDPDSRAVLVWCLLSEGFWVEPVSNGFDAAVALEQTGLPSVAIIDLDLPTLNGRKLIEGMCQSERLAGVPIIATGARQPSAPLPEGVVFMRKPCDPRMVLIKVRELGGERLRSFFPSRAGRARQAGRARGS
jgi:DNA-binding response OmpR family regulator